MLYADMSLKPRHWRKVILVDTITTNKMLMLIESHYNADVDRKISEICYSKNKIWSAKA